MNTRTDVKFAQNVLDVDLDGSFGNVEFARGRFDVACGKERCTERRMGFGIFRGQFDGFAKLGRSVVRTPEDQEGPAELDAGGGKLFVQTHGALEVEDGSFEARMTGRSGNVDRSVVRGQTSAHDADDGSCIFGRELFGFFVSLSSGRKIGATVGVVSLRESAIGRRT